MQQLNIDPDKIKHKGRFSKESKYLALLEYMPHMVWISGADGATLYYNQSLLNYLGIDRDLPPDHNWISYIHPEDAENSFQLWQQAVQTLQPCTIEYRIRSKDGDYRWFLAKAAPLKIAQTDDIIWLGTCTDIHAAKQAHLALQVLTERLDLAMESAQVGSWSWNIKTDIIEWDKHIFRLFGLSPPQEQFSYDLLLRLIHPDDVAVFRQKVEKALLGKLDYYDEFRIIKSGGSIHWLASRGKVFLDAQGKASRFMGVCWNIDEYKRVEHWKQHHQMELTEVAKLSSLRELASQLSHELNQPLTAVTTYLNGCLSKLQNKNENFEFLKQPLLVAAEQAKRAGDILHRLKDFVYTMRLHCVTADINELIQESVAFIFNENNDPKIEIDYQLSCDLPLLTLDRIQIQQVIINLLRNSLDALADSKTRHPHIRITSAHVGKFVAITIQDNGPGIDPTMVDKLFSAYYTTKPYGMGLGLAICQSIIEAHGGSISYLTPSTPGACIQFTLPIS